MSNKTIRVIAKTAQFWALGPGKGLSFGFEPTELSLADKADLDHGEITAAQLAVLQANPHLTVIVDKPIEAKAIETKTKDTQTKDSKDTK